MTSRVTQSQLVAALQTLAPLRLAEDWDNVGLLLEPSDDRRIGTNASTSIGTVLLTIDLTAAVVDEALREGAELIVAYHPPIFSGLKRITRDTTTGRIVGRLLSAGVCVYSPHTALDATVGGINDWLVDGLGNVAAREPIKVARAEGAQIGAGQGRIATLADEVALSDMLDRIKSHLGLAHVRVATPQTPRPIRRIAVCPGSGGALFADIENTDLVLTGELRHHDVLHQVGRGTTVVLTEHTNSERGYLPHLAAKLRAVIGTEVRVLVAAADRDPLMIR